ncbi:MAG TPA: M1 family metallopeptidase [Opitutaceae bacterium]|nr:M1 family metallopeptidase [Opitutaceae bacterium]
MRVLPALRAIATVLALAATVRAEKPFSFNDTPGQLPKTVIPRHYVLRIQPDLNARTTTGTARIDIEVTQPVRTIVLNALELDITACALLRAGSNAPQALVPAIDGEKQTLTLTLPAALAPGRHALTISYRGKIGTQAQGFFVDKYPTASGDKLMLGTQFEPTDARRVFPCWDEPAYRATYDITFVVEEKLMAIANTPIAEEKLIPGGWKEVTFTRTPAMSTYLVALYAGEFETLEGEQDGVKLRIVTTEGKRAAAAYALESTKRILAYYNAYFGVRYPLPKLDQIAVPSAFARFSAMENWGAITYIDTAILYDPAVSSQARREQAFGTIAHEIAHQWFGNLVTTAWWDNLWLNEGFASWMGTKCSDALNPEWQLWVRANEDKERAMELDARKATHPVQTPVANESQASDAFDEISYKKGQSFLRMLEAYLGEDTFRAGIRRYIAAHQYSNTTTANLWSALEAASGQPVTALAAAWTEQPGFPVVVAALVPGSGQPTLRLEQFRFTLNDPQAGPLSWKIPLTLGDPAKPDAAVALLLEDRASIKLPPGTATVKANLGDTGYYRVFYAEALGDELRRQIRTLPPADQLNLLGDTWAFVESGRVSATSWLDMAAQLGDSRSQPVWEHMIDRFALIDLLEGNQRERPAFQAWAAQFLAPQLARLGWAASRDESPLDTSLRANLVLMLGRFGDRAVIAECTRRFELFRQDPTTLTGDLRDSVLNIVGRHATRDVYDQLHAFARAAHATEDKRVAYGAMQAALDPALARETLALSLGSELSVNESARNVARVAAEAHPALAWEFALRHLDALLAQVAFFGRNQYLPGIAKSFTDAARADELEAHVRRHSPPDAFAETAKISDLIRHRDAVKRRELPAINAWVKERVKRTD